jgi:hypothetical protein
LQFLQTEDTKTVVFNDRFLTYSKIEGQIQLHSSQDAVNWTNETVTGLPGNTEVRGIQSNGSKLFAYTEDGELYVRYDVSADNWISVNKPASIKIKSILGYLTASPKQEEGLCLVVETGGVNTFAFTKDFIQWDYDSIAPTPVPENFPLYDFSNYNYKVMLIGRVTVFGGISQNGIASYAVWSTENGRYWAKITGSRNDFPGVKGANVFHYNNELWLVNGWSDVEYNKRIYYSRDGGVTWWIRLMTDMDEDEEMYEIFPAPQEYSPRYNASVVTDKNNKYFYIIGGKHDDVLPEVWKVYLNKMEFDH